jgi:hypothetical protein
MEPSVGEVAGSRQRLTNCTNRIMQRHRGLVIFRSGRWRHSQAHSDRSRIESHTDRSPVHARLAVQAHRLELNGEGGPEMEEEPIDQGRGLIRPTPAPTSSIPNMEEEEDTGVGHLRDAYCNPPRSTDAGDEARKRWMRRLLGRVGAGLGRSGYQDRMTGR